MTKITAERIEELLSQAPNHSAEWLGEDTWIDEDLA